MVFLFLVFTTVDAEMIMIMSVFVYKDVNYDVFCDKRVLQDFNQKITTSINFFRATKNHLFNTYFDYFILDLAAQIKRYNQN